MKNDNDKNKKDKVASDAMEEEIKEDAASASNVARADVVEVEVLHKKLEEAENRYKRALADYHNLQKRVNEEKQDWVRAANKELLLRLLPVLDTLMLASRHITDQGLQVSINQFLDTLKAEGVTKVKTEDEEFNPHVMECVTVEEGEDNKVLEEIRAGYMMYDKILRPAQVKVGKGK